MHAQIVEGDDQLGEARLKAADLDQRLLDCACDAADSHDVQGF